MFIFLPTMLLFKPPRGGKVSKNALLDRFTKFAQGQWLELLTQSVEASAATTELRSRWRRTGMDSVEKRAERAEALICLGEISAARRALEASPVAPGAEETYRALRTARREAAGGPSGMCTEHLRPLLDNDVDSNRVFEVSQAFAQAKIPDEIASALRVGQLTALRKPNGGVRGIVVGDVIRRRVAKTISQQFMERFENATTVNQSRKRSVAHVVQALTVNNAALTVLSIDGVGAFDLISRRAMMEAPSPDA